MIEQLGSLILPSRFSLRSRNSVQDIGDNFEKFIADVDEPALEKARFSPRMALPTLHLHNLEVKGNKVRALLNREMNVHCATVRRPLGFWGTFGTDEFGIESAMAWLFSDMLLSQLISIVGESINTVNTYDIYAPQFFENVVYALLYRVGWLELILWKR